MYVGHRFEYIVIIHLILMVALAFYFAPAGWPMLPLALLHLALFMMPEDLRFASDVKIRLAKTLFGTSLAVNTVLFLFGGYVVFTAGPWGFFFWYLAGINLAIANRVGRALKSIEHHPPSPLARGAEENSALDAASFWEKATYFGDFAVAGYVGFMVAGAISQISTGNTIAFLGKWIWPGLLIVALVMGVRNLRRRALDTATQAALEKKGEGATVTKPALIVDDRVMPAVVRGGEKKTNKKQRRQGGFIGEMPMRVTTAASGRTGGYGQWVVLFVWFGFTLCGYISFKYAPFTPSALSGKTGMLIAGLSTAVVLWLMAVRIRRAPQQVARDMARKTFLDRLFAVCSLFVIGPLLLAFPLYALAYTAHGLTAQTTMETQRVDFADNGRPCVYLEEDKVGFCMDRAETFAAAVNEGNDLSFMMQRSISGVSVESYAPRHGGMSR